MYYKIDKVNKKYLAYLLSRKKRFWSRGLVKSRQNNWRGSRSRETEVGEKIAPLSTPFNVQPHWQIVGKVGQGQIGGSPGEE